MTTNEFDTLPIRDYKDEIVKSVNDNQVTIITAETGAGKSTQVPQYLAEAGYQRVIVTQPRILAARNLSRRVREEWAIKFNEDSDDVIGYRTAHERDDNGNSQILYCTDGLQLVRELTGIGIGKRQVLVLDEVHEWNENMEVLVAWAKRRCEQELDFKVVIMSATIETDDLSQYYGTEAVINVPGRSFDVVHRRGRDVAVEVLSKIEDANAYNVLVFLPGKAEIEAMKDAISPQAVERGIPVIPLHSQLEATAQQEAFASYPHGKVILSTNIAQTSVTIDDIDVVIDSGLERRSEVRSGVEGLFMAQISQADCMQRAGRAGRTKPGEYILAPFDTLECLDFEERPEYPVPEILRKHIDRLTLRLASIDIDIESLDFYHDPSHKAIKQAKRTLVSLEALTTHGQITAIGRAMERFPVESSYARMLVEVKRYNSDIQLKLAAIIAIAEVGGITKNGSRYTGWRALTRQNKSDLLAQYDVLLALDRVNELEYEDMGIITKNIDKAREVINRLQRDLGLEDQVLTPITFDQAPLLMKSIVAGQLHQLWTVARNGVAIHLRTKDKRELSNSSVVRGGRLVAGAPFDLEITNRWGELETLHIVQNLTIVEADWLRELAPKQFQIRPGRVYFDSSRGRLARRQVVTAHGQVVEGESQDVDVNSEKAQRQFVEGYAQWVFDNLENESRILRRKHKKVPSVRLADVQAAVKPLLQNVRSLDELSRDERKSLDQLSSIYAWKNITPTYGDDKPYRPERKRRFTPKHKRRNRQDW